MEQGTWKAWRDQVSDWHPLPDGFDCVAYLVTEAAEALDAALRLRRPDDDRSHARGRALARELAQVVDMAYAAALRYDVDLDAACAEWRDEVRLRRGWNAHADSSAQRDQ